MTAVLQPLNDDVLPEKGPALGRSLIQTALVRLRRDKLTLIALSILLLLVVLAVLAPVISSQILHVEYTRTNINDAFLPIGAPGHLLGTDDLGRDHLARLLFGAQVSLGIATFSALLSLVIGVVAGVITGYFGGIVDDFVNWVITTLSSIPGLFLLLIIFAVFSPTPATIIITLGLLGWTGTARLVRGETLALREREFLVGARAIGASPWRIMASHIVPNVISVVVISLAIDIGGLILTEAALSFLGFGVRQPAASWGNMLTNAQEFFTKSVHLVVLPGLLITITVLCLYLVGDGLRDAFDPQLGGKS